MKKIFLLSLFLCISCSSTSSIISSNSENESFNQTSEIEIEDFDTEESEDRLVLSSKNKTNTSYCSFKCSYSNKGITFYVNVKDDDLYSGNIYNIGYDDNFEILINQKTDESGWDTNFTYHFLMNAEGKTLFEKAISKNGLGLNYSPSLNIVFKENFNYSFRLLNEKKDGYNGYYAEVFFSYDILNTTYEDGFGQISFCPGMRNSHDYLNDTTWSSYNKRNCRWSSSSSFVIIHQDGTFDEGIK